MNTKILQIVFACTVLSFSANAQQMLPAQPVIQHFTPDQYNAKADNYCFVQDRRGFIYAANGSGVLEFDGVRWRLIPLANRSTAKWLTLDKNGTIYVCGQGEFGRLEPDSSGTLSYRSIINQETYPQFSSQDFWETVSTSDGIFIRSYQYLIRYRDGALKTWSAGSNAFDLITVVRDTLYTRIRNESLVRVAGDSLVHVPGGAFFSKIKINGILPFSDSRILIASRFDGLFLYDGQKAEPLKTDADDYFRKYLIYDAKKTANDHYVFATLQGGVVFMDEHFNVTMILDETNGLPVNGVNSVFVDMDQSVWLGHGFHGISRVENISPLLLLSSFLGLKGRVVRMIRFNGYLYLMTNNAIYRLIEHGDKFRFDVLHANAPSYFDMTVAAGDLLAATDRGIFKIQGDRVQAVSALFSRTIHAAAWDSSLLIVGLNTGLVLFRRDVNAVWKNQSGTPKTDIIIRSAFSDRNGILWYGSDFEGVGRLHFSIGQSVPDTVEKFGIGHGLPAGEITVWSAGAVPIFSGYDGFYEFDETIKRFSKLSEHLVRSVLQNGTSWSALNPGRWVINPMTVAMMEQQSGIYRIWGLMKTKEYVYWKDPDRTEWYGGDYLLVRHKDSGKVRAPVLPAAYVRQASAGNTILFGGERERTSGTVIRFPESPDPFKILFAAPIYELAPEFQFRLIGLDKDWSEWSWSTTKEYTHLPSGTYRFEVRARDIYGRVTESDHLDFVITPPWYQTLWATIFYGLAAIALFTFIVRYRVLRLKRKNIELEAVVAKRTAELRHTEAQLVQSEKMAAVGQMVAGVMHEINNPLTFIIPNLEYIQTQLKSFFEKLRKHAVPKEIASMVDDFDQDINVALKSSVNGSHRIREIVVSLKKLTGQGFNAVMDTQIGHHLTGIVELFFRQNEQVAFITEFKDSSAVQIHILEFNQCLIGILNNAVQAIQDAEDAQLIGKKEGCVFISTEDIADKQVRIIIRDNGIGIDPKVISHIFEPFFTTRTIGTGKGLGLSEAYAVIRKLKGTIEVQSELRKGTSVIITLPVVGSLQS